MQTILKLGLGLLTAWTSGIAQAQVGRLDYGPLALASQPVPTGGLTVYILLALTLTALAYWAIKKRDSTKFTALLIAVLLAGTAALNDSPFIAKASARIIITGISLNDPQGGSVVIPAAAETFTNTSGVPQQIFSISPPCRTNTNVAPNACTVGRVLGQSEGCNTDYPSCRS